MKNVFFALAFMLVGTFAFASSEVNKIEEFVIINQDTVENSITSEVEAVFPCCWRDCVIINGVKYCTDWECGECIIIIQ